MKRTIVSVICGCCLMLATAAPAHAVWTAKTTRSTPNGKLKVIQAAHSSSPDQLALADKVRYKVKVNGKAIPVSQSKAEQLFRRLFNKGVERTEMGGGGGGERSGSNLGTYTHPKGTTVQVVSKH
jgi:hypothetical protein